MPKKLTGGAKRAEEYIISVEIKKTNEE